MNVEEKVELVTRPPTEEVITVKELRELFENKDRPNHYIGYEISEKLHVGSLIFPGLKVRDLIEAGCNCIAYLSDWHAWLNNKMDGDFERIKKTAEYYREAFKLLSPKLKVFTASDLYHNNDEHWENMVLVSKHSTLKRVTRCLTIMGRKEGESLDFAQYIYPSLQAADIKTMEIDIAHAGMDQRKVHMLARDVFPKLKWKAPVALHHHLLPGLLKPERDGYDENARLDMEISSKMSKSKPWTCIFIHDSREDIKKKMEKAWCPAKVAENNGVLEMAKYLIFREFGSLEVSRPAKYGGNVTFEDYATLEKSFKKGELHPMDLKMALVEPLDKIVKPYREHFKKPAKAKLLSVYNAED